MDNLKKKMRTEPTVGSERNFLQLFLQKSATAIFAVATAKTKLTLHAMSSYQGYQQRSQYLTNMNLLLGPLRNVSLAPQ